MLTLDSNAQNAVNANARGVALLVEMDVTGGTQYFTTWPVSIVVDGHTYLGFGNLVTVDGLSESEDRSARNVTFSFTIVNTALLSLLISDATQYRRKAIRIYQQFMDSAYVPAGAKVQRWAGYMDQTTVDRTAPQTIPGGVSHGKINLKCTRAGVPMSRRQIGLRSTHQQQIAKYPTDMGLEYQQQLVEKPTLWLSKRFQMQQ